MTDLLAALGERVLIADGGMGSLLLAHTLKDEDFQGAVGCFEVLNVTRPDVISSIHAAYLEAGADCIETNTFGANYGSLGEYDIGERIFELAKAGAMIARKAADEASTVQHPRFVLGSMGPGTKLPSLKHAPYAILRDAYQTQAEALIEGGVDGFQIETCQDLLQAKAAIVGVKRAQTKLGTHLPIFVNVTFETNGTMLLGSEVGAALTSIASLGIQGIGMNCGTGPEMMSEHLRYLSENTSLPIVCMPNAGLPELTAAGAIYPLTPKPFAQIVCGYVSEFGLNLVGGCCGTTPEHIAELVTAVGNAAPKSRQNEQPPAVSSIFSSVDLRQEVSYLSIGERTNANGSKAFREAMLAGNWDDCIAIAKAQSAAGAHLIDVSVDYVGRDGQADMRELASRLAVNVPLPIMIDSTDPNVIEAGLECLGGRCIINSVNFEDGDGPQSRFAKVMEIAAEHGAVVLALTIDEEGQARTKETKVAIAERLINTIKQGWGFAESDIMVDCLTFPIGTGQEETRKDALETLAAIAEITSSHAKIQTTLGVSNVSFGLNPAARVVLNSVFLDEAVKVGLSSAIVHSARIVPPANIPEEQLKTALDLVYDNRLCDYDPLTKLLDLFADVTLADTRAAQDEELAALPVDKRLQRRIVIGSPIGLAADLEEALAHKDALAIINEDLLEGMRTVGELFGAAKMQLPFVLASAEVMKTAVGQLEPYLEKGDAGAKGTLVLATVSGDVHDIGKNLVDIILSNNGYRVINLGIKQPIAAIAEAAKEHNADAIGLSGLLVKSTLVMRNNLLWLNEQELSHIPVLLGGAALTRSYVESDLQNIFNGRVFYAKDAFEGLSLMEGLNTEALPDAQPRVRARVAKQTLSSDVARSDVSRGGPSYRPNHFSAQAVKGISLDAVVEYLDERALFAGQWGLKPVPDGPSYDELVATEGRPRLNLLLDKIRTEDLADFGVVYGYWQCYSEGNSLILLEDGKEAARLHFPRQSTGRHLCIPDFFRDFCESTESGDYDYLPIQLVTVGGHLAKETHRLYQLDRYRDYLEFNGLCAQLAEALAEYWHARIRVELGLAPDGSRADVIRHQSYQGSRYSFGYPASPDLEQRRTLVELLKPERIGVTITEEFQLDPEFSTDAIIVPHPEAKYFNVR